MWIKTMTGDAVNMEFAVKIEIAEIRAQEYEVVVFSDGGYDTVAIFDNEDAAKKCVEEIVNVLNGGKVGYSFSWLKKSEPADTEKVEEGTAEKPKDKTPALIDGIAL